MRAKLANLNHCAVSFLSRAAVNLSWYEATCIYCVAFIYIIRLARSFDVYSRTRECVKGTYKDVLPF